MSAAEMQSSFAAALLNGSDPIPDNITSSRGKQDAARFAVYRNNVFVGLTRALAQRFAVTERLVGADFFRQMARLYAQGHLPACPLMMEYGAGFPDFIAGFGPAASLAYLPDVARIEAACTHAYHAADHGVLNLAALAAIAPEDLARVRLVRHPSAALIRSRFAVGSIWQAHQTAEVTPVSVRTAETVLVLRPALTVGVHILPPCDAEFAAALLDGEPLGVSAERALMLHPDFDVGRALVGLISLGAFSTLQLDEGDGL